MTLNKQDVNYRNSSQARTTARFFVGLLAGVLANWTWLFIIVGLYGVGELFTMYKILTHSQVTDEKLNDLSPELKGRYSGVATFSAFTATLSTLAVALIVKGAKIGLVWCYQILF